MDISEPLFLMAPTLQMTQPGGLCSEPPACLFSIPARVPSGHEGNQEGDGAHTEEIPQEDVGFLLSPDGFR